MDTLCFQCKCAQLHALISRTRRAVIQQQCHFHREQYVAVRQGVKIKYCGYVLRMFVCVNTLLSLWINNKQLIIVTILFRYLRINHCLAIQQQNYYYLLFFILGTFISLVSRAVMPRVTCAHNKQLFCHFQAWKIYVLFYIIYCIYEFLDLKRAHTFACRTQSDKLKGE